MQLSQKESTTGAACCKKGGCCCNLSVSVALNVHITMNGMCMKDKNDIYVVQTSKKRVTSSGDLYS